MDLQTICRLCSFKLHKPRDIFTTPGLLDKISKFTDIQIQQGDGLPSSICDLCNIRLQITDKFRHQVGKADELIRAFVLKQAAELSESRRLSPAETTLPQNGVEKWLENGFQPQPISQIARQVRRERMRLSERRRPWQLKLSKTAELSTRDSSRSLIYSYGTARSLVASYKALINRCRIYGLSEEFSLPSSFGSSDNDESDERDERAVRFAAARRRLQRDKRGSRKYFADKKRLRNIARAVTNRDLNTGEISQGLISPKIPADPLNLLKVKSVRPLVDEDTADSFADSFSGGFSPGTEDVEDYSSPECSSPDGNYSEESWQSCSSGSSKSSVKTNGQQSKRDFSLSFPIAGGMGSERVVGDPENRKSEVQCPICDRICVTMHGLKVHFRSHRSTTCQICEAPTETKEKFRDHVLLHVNPIRSNDSFVCGVCKNSFSTRVGLNTHARIHCMSVPAVKECPQCKKVFATIRGFRIHRAKSHSGFDTE